MAHHFVAQTGLVFELSLEHPVDELAKYAAKGPAFPEAVCFDRINDTSWSRARRAIKAPASAPSRLS
jgi:hypothetical protein